MEFYTYIAKYTFFGIRDEKLLASARKSWYHTMVCSGIEAVITGLTRNLLPLEPPKISNPLCFKHSPGFIEVHIFACSILFFYPIPDLVFFKDLG